MNSEKGFMKKQFGPTEIFYPVPTALVSCGDLEKPNIITVVWISVIDNSPPTLGVSFNKQRYSLQLIREHKCFGVNLPLSKHYKEVDFCGITSGKDINKFEAAKFTPIKGSKTQVPLIKECPVNLECKLVKEVTINERIFIVGEILETHVDEDKIIDAEKGKPDVSKLDPLIYCNRLREYWTIGEKLGNGFSAGKELLTSK